MIYTDILLIFGLIPTIILWSFNHRLIGRYKRSLITITVLIMLVSIPWEMVAINHIWYYSPEAIQGARFLDLPVEELAFFIIDSLLVGTLTLLLVGKEPGR